MVVPWTRSYTRMQIKFASPPAEEEWIEEIWTVRTTARISITPPQWDVTPKWRERELCVPQTLDTGTIMPGG